MSDMVIRENGNGVFRLEGVLSFASVPELLPKGATLFRDNMEIRLDLRSVTRSDSAGLAILIEWMRMAERSGSHITFFNVPHQMLAIARVSGLDEILPMKRGPI